MISIVVSIILVLVLKIIEKYTNFLKENQYNFIFTSSVFYILLFGVLKSLIMGEQNILFSNHTYYPLLFFILWYSVSTIIINNITYASNIGILFRPKLGMNRMSQRKIRK